MMSNKNYRLSAEDIQQLISSMGGCIATDKITVDGLPIGYMYRQVPINELDSGWCFFSGTETQEYIDDLSNSNVFDVNTIANYDPSIIPYLNMPIGVELERTDGKNTFSVIER